MTFRIYVTISECFFCPHPTKPNQPAFLRFIYKRIHQRGDTCHGVGDIRMRALSQDKLVSSDKDSQLGSPELRTRSLK
jgi:hypothetical protein